MVPSGKLCCSVCCNVGLSSPFFCAPDEADEPSKKHNDRHYYSNSDLSGGGEAASAAIVVALPIISLHQTKVNETHAAFVSSGCKGQCCWCEPSPRRVNNASRLSVSAKNQRKAHKQSLCNVPNTSAPYIPCSCWYIVPGAAIYM